MSQLGPFLLAFLLLSIKIQCVVSKSVYYVRIPRAEEPQHAFNNLMTAQMYDYEEVPPSSLPTPMKLIELPIPDEQESYQFMEGPVSLSNPLVNIITKFSDIYRWASDLNRSPTDEDMY